MQSPDEMRGFWTGKRVLMTGHTGFKGSWMSLWLQMLGAKVLGFSLAPPTQPSLFELANVRKDMISIHGDVRDLAALTKAFRDFRPEIVFHMAAQSLVRLSYRDPIGTYTTNVIGTANVLEACRHEPLLRAVVNVTSDKCYENTGAVRSCREDDPMGGHDPYSSSKGCAELVTSAYRRSFFGEGPSASPAAVASGRAGNVIGGGDWALDRLVPDCIRSILAGKPIVIRNPKAVRPWQHVLEPLGGYLLLARRLHENGKELAEGWNFGPDEADAMPVSHVADRLTALWGGGAAWAVDSGSHPHEAAYLRLDCSKARERLGWRSRMNIETALQWVVDWHKRLAAGQNARQLCQEQITRFMEQEVGAHG
jgi:CDP-glucose 4,6-dehydratase